MNEDERRKSQDLGHRAFERASKPGELAELVDQLGESKHPDAVPLLTKLWRDCALETVRNAAGHALRSIGTPEARESLKAFIEDTNHLSVYLGIAAVFDEHPNAAFDTFAPYFNPTRLARPGGAVVARSVLGTFAPNTFRYSKDGRTIPGWSMEKAPTWFRDDTRWLSLCITHRRHKQLGGIARNVLRFADSNRVAAALAKAREVPRTVVVATSAPGNLVERYRKGEHVAVWNELRGHETPGGELLEEARAVAAETMSLVARNADILAERLAAAGWKPLYGKLRTKPQIGDGKVIRRIEKITKAALPVSMCAFWEVVGGINFVWNYNLGEAPSLGVDLPMDQMDPLSVDSPKEVTYQFEEWKEQREGIDPELADPFRLDLAPDYLHKANISGGGPYGIELPLSRHRPCV